jgi:hypothetical protein
MVSPCPSPCPTTGKAAKGSSSANTVAGRIALTPAHIPIMQSDGTAWE